MTSLLVLLLVAAPDAAPAVVAKASARTAQQILDDYAKAIGGAEVMKKHRTLHLRREIEVKGMQIRGTEERWAASAGKSFSRMEIPGVATFRTGTNGKVYWTEDPINGLRILKGVEQEQARLEAVWDAETRLGELYKETRVVAAPVEPPTGRTWECVELVPNLGQPVIVCFDAATHLRTLQKGVEASPQGDMPYVARFDDWKEVDGLKVPHREEMVAGPVTLQSRVAELQFGAKVDPKIFELPKPGKPGKLPKPKAGPPAAGAPGR